MQQIWLLLPVFIVSFTKSVVRPCIAFCSTIPNYVALPVPPRSIFDTALYIGFAHKTVVVYDSITLQMPADWKYWVRLKLFRRIRIFAIFTWIYLVDWIVCRLEDLRSPFRNISNLNHLFRMDLWALLQQWIKTLLNCFRQSIFVGRIDVNSLLRNSRTSDFTSGFHLSAFQSKSVSRSYFEPIVPREVIVTLLIALGKTEFLKTCFYTVLIAEYSVAGSKHNLGFGLNWHR
jgi:hypothetical protein